MEYFKEKNGNFYSKSLQTGFSRSPISRLVLSLLPLGLFALVFSTLTKDKAADSEMVPIIIGAAVLTMGNIVAFALRSAGLNASMIVNQVQGTVSLRIPGGQRKSVGIDSIEKIVLQISNENNAVIALLFKDRTRTVVETSRDPNLLRQVADELSILTTVTVNEEITS
jgi:hypothetical protein